MKNPWSKLTLAKLDYEFKRNPKSPFIFNILPLPVPVIWSNGDVEYLCVNGHRQSIERVSYTGEPRYSEFGINFNPVVQVRHTFNLHHFNFWVCGRLFKFQVYLESDSQEMRRKAVSCVRSFIYFRY